MKENLFGFVKSTEMNDISDAYISRTDCGNIECEKIYADTAHIANMLGISLSNMLREVEKQIIRPMCEAYFQKKNFVYSGYCRFRHETNSGCTIAYAERKLYGYIYVSDANASRSGACKTCLENAGKTFKYPEEESLMPKLPIHPNCKCYYKKVYNSGDWSTSRYSPEEKYIVGDMDFNKNRKSDEMQYGKEIDTHTFSAPGKEIESDLQNGSSLYSAVKNNITFREGLKNKIYLDSKGIPSIGIGINLLEKNNQKKLREAGFLTDEQIAALNTFKPGRERIIPPSLVNVNLPKEQIDTFFYDHYVNAVADAKKIMKIGSWQINERKNQYWNNTKIDEKAWEQLPALAKAIVIDLTFSLGYSEAKLYVNFFRAIKAHDYRRAAIELINSDDYKIGANGTKLRRRDAAIELTHLAEEEVQKKNTQKK